MDQSEFESESPASQASVLPDYTTGPYQLKFSELEQSETHIGANGRNH